MILVSPLVAKLAVVALDWAAARLHLLAGPGLGVLADAVKVEPTSAGMPGGPFVQTLLNWLGQLVLWASLAALLVGGAVAGFAERAGYVAGASKGRLLAMAGAVGAIITGLGPAVVNVLFDVARRGA